MLVHRSFDPEDLPQALLSAAQDQTLSYGARGLLLELLTGEGEPEASAVSLSRAAKMARGDKGEGRDSVRALLDELKQHGYFSQQRYRARRGQMSTRNDLYEAPQGEQAKAAPVPSADVVYVIGPPGQSVAKIGTTSSLGNRLKGIQTGSPLRLEVLWSHPGDWRLEDFLHVTFEPLRLEGEWFDFGDADPVAEVASAVAKYQPPTVEVLPRAIEPDPRAA
ncbi:GIY-YIG nuclease family protein [Streptomyces angustmyceticus]